MRLATGLLLFAGLTACQERREIVVFHAASLSRAFTDLREAYVARHPHTRMRIEVSGSQTAARKVAELGLRADVVASADASVIDHILLPEHATWNLQFATNELVLVHQGHSRFTEEVGTGNWHEVLTRPGVSVGLVDPDLGPIGYRTLLVWQLAEHAAPSPGLANHLRARVAREHVMSDESELLALLSARAIDYAFMYRSTADEHHLKITRLSNDINLGHADRAGVYAAASVEVRMRHGLPPVRVAGAPVLYGVTIPTTAPNLRGGEELVALLLGEQGRRILARTGFLPLVPARTAQPTQLPELLRPLTGSAP